MMERLTEKYRGDDRYYMACSETCGSDMDCMDCPTHDRLVERLAAYEDTGLTPEEVNTLQKDWSYLCTVVGECGGLSRVRALTEADRDGRLVALPCKVGDTVYRVFIVDGREPVIQATQVKTLGQAADLIGRVGKLNKLVSVFQTREEAEKALEEKSNE